MPPAGESVRFDISVKNGPGESWAVLTFAKVSKGEVPFWKGIVRVGGEETRYFGNPRRSMRLAAEQLLSKLSGRCSQDVARRVLQMVDDMQQRVQPSRPGSQASLPGSQPRVRLRYKTPRPRTVASYVSCIHQIYGVFRDDQPMVPLFKSSEERWRKVALDMGAQYHLWNADELDWLMKNHYPQFWAMYCQVRYPVMRVDIGRVAILHSYGGMYADLDTFPNRRMYAEESFAVGRVEQATGRLSAKATGRLSAKHTRKPTEEKERLEMKVIIGRKGNPAFLSWLAHMQHEIDSNEHSSQSSLYTTGPMSMTRFLNARENAQVLAEVNYLHCNKKVETKLTFAERRMSDCMSHERISYSTKAHRVHVEISDGSASLPTFAGMALSQGAGKGEEHVQEEPPRTPRKKNHVLAHSQECPFSQGARNGGRKRLTAKRLASRE